MPVYETLSAAETVSLGRRLAAGLRPGVVVAFYGDLGAGKTTMIKGIAEALGVRETVKSPSYVIATEYRGNVPVVHVDLYRLAGPEGLDDIGLDEYLGGNGVCLVEWADRAGNELPVDSISVRIEVAGAERRIRVEGLEVPTGETA